MRKRLFGVRPTNKVDVYMSAGTAVLAIIGFFGVLHEYKSEQKSSENQEIES